MELTDLEVEALYWELHHPIVVKTQGKLRSALKRAKKKISAEKLDRRRRRVFETGVRHAQNGKDPNPVIDGQFLGCQEQFTYYEGYCSVCTDVQHPYKNEKLRL